MSHDQCSQSLYQPTLEGDVPHTVMQKTHKVEVNREMEELVLFSRNKQETYISMWYNWIGFTSPDKGKSILHRPD